MTPMGAVPFGAPTPMLPAAPPVLYEPVILSVPLLTTIEPVLLSFPLSVRVPEPTSVSTNDAAVPLATLPAIVTLPEPPTYRFLDPAVPPLAPEIPPAIVNN